MMGLHQLLQASDRIGVVVHTQVQIAIIVSAVATVGPHNQHTGSLFAPAVAANGVTSQQCRNQPVGQLAGCGDEGFCHSIERFRPGEDIALAGEAFTNAVTSPIKALTASVSGGVAIHVHHADLTVFAVWVGGQQRFKRFLGGLALCHHGEAIGAKWYFGIGLGGHGTCAGLRPADHRRCRQEFAGDCHTPGLFLRIISHDRERVELQHAFPSRSILFADITPNCSDNARKCKQADRFHVCAE